MQAKITKGFKNVTIFIRTGQTDENGFPIVEPEPLILGESEHINNRSLELTEDVQETELTADNQIITLRTVMQRTGTLTAYYVSTEVLIKLFGFEKDINNNLLSTENVSIPVVLFYETETGNMGMQHWLYDCTLSSPAEAYTTFDGTNVTELAMPIEVRPIFALGKDKNGALRSKAIVMQGNEGYVTGIPQEIYIPTFATEPEPEPEPEPETASPTQLSNQSFRL